MSYRLGIDLGGTAFKVGIIDDAYNIIVRGSAPTDPLTRSFSDVVADMAALSARVAGEAGLALSDLSCAGLGTPGGVDAKNGVVVFAGNLGWHNVSLRDALKAHLGIPTFIGNDANCAIVGETAAGAARGRKNVLMLTLGTGIGSGIIIDGKLFTGSDGMGAELGHTPFVFDGVPCTCGIHGCLEAYASITGLIRQTRAAMEAHPESAMHAHAAENHDRVTGRTAFDCARQGDRAALAVVDVYTSYVAAGIGGFVNIFRPEIVLIGGGISHEGDFLLGPLNQKLPSYLFAGDILPAPPVIAATLENDAGIIGAACLSEM